MERRYNRAFIGSKFCKKAADFEAKAVEDFKNFYPECTLANLEFTETKREIVVTYTDVKTVKRTKTKE